MRRESTSVRAEEVVPDLGPLSGAIIHPAIFLKYRFSVISLRMLNNIYSLLVFTLMQ